MISLNKIARFFNVLHILLLCVVLFAGYGVQFLSREESCPLCLLQRLAMIGIALSLLCNLKFGIKPLHYGLGIVSSIFGGSVSLRQIALHVCPQFTTFGEPIFGLAFYSWVFIVFCVSLLLIALDLFIYETPKEKRVKMHWLEKFVFGLVTLVTLANFVTALMESLS